jgi:hypothetical protein
MSAATTQRDPLTAQQLDLLDRMSMLSPAPLLFGGFAEDALLAGRVTRSHADLDWIFPRREFGLRLAQARTLGFTEFQTIGEAAPGEPFYLFAQSGDLQIDLGISDEIDGRDWACVHRLAFDIDGAPAPAGYRFALPADTYQHPPVTIEGIRVRVVSPLALYQLRAGLAARGTFGPLSEQQQATAGRLREVFFPDRLASELTPEIQDTRGDRDIRRIVRRHAGGCAPHGACLGPHGP